MSQSGHFTAEVGGTVVVAFSPSSLLLEISSPLEDANVEAYLLFLFAGDTWKGCAVRGITPIKSSRQTEKSILTSKREWSGVDEAAMVDYF